MDELCDAKELVLTFWRDVWSNGQSELIEKIFHPDAKENGEPMNLTAFMKAVDKLRRAFPDFNVAVDDIFAVTSNKVVSRVTYSGTQETDWFGLPAMSKSFTTIGIDIFTIQDGQITELWHATDHLDLVLQLGGKVVPGESE